MYLSLRPFAVHRDRQDTQKFLPAILKRLRGGLKRLYENPVLNFQ